MATLRDKASTTEAVVLRRVTNLLGGDRVIRHRLQNAMDVHEALIHGLPGAALTHLVGSLVVRHDPTLLEKAVGMSVRTIQRRKGSPSKPLSQEQSGRTWKFAEILAKATEVFGSQEEAEQWLEHPAIGLDQWRPIDLLSTPAGVRVVEEFLERMEFGVYA
jgi:putative toxin-antitoxin system antitoxin component (TIGR02293 family)